MADRQIQISEKAFQTFERWRKTAPTAQKPASGGAPGGCGLVIVFGPNGDIVDADCGGGGCGIIGWLLGRSCSAEISPGEGGNQVVLCRCGGGWFDRIFG